jgi:hypothetical protein
MFLESIIAAINHTTVLSNSTECSYYSCDNSADYFGTGSNPLGDGVIYPDQSAVTTSHHMMLANSSNCTGYSCDNSDNYLGTPSWWGSDNLTGDGVIYPKYEPFANAEHSTMLSSAPDDSGAYYCTVPEAKCPLNIVDPVLKPIQYPVFAANAGHNSMLSSAPDHSGAYFCTEPEANCSVNVVDPVLKPIQYPVFAAAAVPLAPEVSQEAKSARASPGHFLLMGNACLLGAAEATSMMASNIFSAEKMEKDVFSQWADDFSRTSQEACGTVTPVGKVMLSQALH